MNFCSIDDIRADFKGIMISTDTEVTETQCTDLIGQESDYIRARVGVRYDVSVFDPPGSDLIYVEAYNILRRICIFRVSERIRNIIEIKRNETQQSSDEKYPNNKVRNFKDDLTLIVDGSLLLKDVPLLNKNGSVSSFSIDNCGQNVFDTNKQQW